MLLLGRILAFSTFCGSSRGAEASTAGSVTQSEQSHLSCKWPDLFKIKIWVPKLISVCFLIHKRAYCLHPKI